MKLERKIELQKRTIDRLEKEKSELQEKCDSLQSEIDLIHCAKDKGYDGAKVLIEEIHPLMEHLNKAIKEAKEAKEKYDDSAKELRELKIKYDKEIKKMLSTFKKESKDITKPKK